MASYLVRLVRFRLMATIECDSFGCRYPPVNSCIYCGRKPPEATLSLEHIIPKSIKGYLKLPASSCEKCADITKRFEQVFARKMFGALRLHSGLGWGKKTETPKTLDGVHVLVEGHFEHQTVKIEDHPFVFLMPGFPPPRALLTDERGGNHKKMRFWMYNIQGNTNERAERLGAKVRVQQLVPIYEFNRTLAKIAHSFACASIDRSTFDPTLLGIINGTSKDISDWIGGADSYIDRPDTARQDNLHNIWINKASLTADLTGPGYLVVCIQLFACFNAPIYQVVAGNFRS